MARPTLHDLRGATGTTEPRHAGGDRMRDLGRVLLASVVIAVGGLYLLEAAGVLDAGAAIDDWWPVLLVAVGVFQIIEGTHGGTEPLLWLGAGAVLLASTTDVLGEDAWNWVWPAALVAGGVLILLRWAGVTRGGGRRDASDGMITASGILGGQHVASTAPAFAGAVLTAVLGGVDLDLRQARLDPAGATVTATAVLGGIEILVPRDWRVVTGGTPLLGGIDDAREPQDPAPPVDAPVLRVDAFAVMGGVEVRNTPKKG